MKFKRFLDFIVSLICLIVLVPIYLVLAILIVIFIGKPFLYFQLRPGLNGRPFYIFKFRSMLELKDSSGNLLADSKRLNSFGRLLRSTSLDELPSLWNVLRGEMSLVGPRPLLMEYLPLYSPQQSSRHHVKPGITGWAQVNGRNAISWEDKFAYDVWYVENQSFWLDMKIILLTIKKVFFRDGISADGEATMPKFRGNIH